MPAGGMGSDCDQTLVGGNLTKTGYTNVPDPQPHISSNSLTKWLPGAELVYGRGGSGASWTEPRCTVKSVAAGAAAGTVDIIMAQPCWDRAVDKGPSIGTGQGMSAKHLPTPTLSSDSLCCSGVTHPSDVENSLEFLQSPLLAKGSDGEWFGDFAANTVYYKPLPVRHTRDLTVPSAVISSRLTLLWLLLAGREARWDQGCARDRPKGRGGQRQRATGARHRARQVHQPRVRVQHLAPAILGRRIC